MGDGRASVRAGGAGGRLSVRGLMIVGLIGSALLSGPPAGAQTEAEEKPGAEKSGYTLPNPTPRDLMRPMEGDRPDLTESPITVDAGHLQIETGFISYSDNPEDGVERSWSALNETNFRLGVLNDTEVQAIVTPYTEETIKLDGGGTETADGFGDVTVRVKQNLWGNDSGDTAFAVMPAIKIPTGTELSNGRVEGSVIGTLGWDVAENWGLGFQVEPGAAWDEADDDYDFELGHTAVLAFDIVDPLGGYVEYGGVLNSESAEAYEAVLSTGLTYGLSRDVMLDLGTRIGLTGEAENATVSTGITMRF